jgi:hypothetical protein
MRDERVPSSHTLKNAQPINLATTSVTTTGYNDNAAHVVSNASRIPQGTKALPSVRPGSGPCGNSTKDMVVGTIQL